MARPVTPLLIQLARQYGLDPDAVVAVARGEGGLVNRPGTQDIGDLSGGGSYGPFQLYARGALPQALRGRRDAADAWAWSPQGIRYALGRMVAAGAKGLRGADAVETIIRRFERPQDPGTSIRNALARLGSVRSGPIESGGVERVPVGGLPAPSPVGPSVNPSVGRKAAARALLMALSQGRSVSESIPDIVSARKSALEEALSRQPVAGPRSVIPTPNAGTPRPAGNPISPFALAELYYGQGGWEFVPGKGLVMAPPVPGHDTHVHAGFRNPQSALRAIKLAQSLGLAVRENPYVDPVDPVHTKGSYHYRRFPGLYSGRPLGEAVDVSGNAARLARYSRLLRGLGAR